MQGAVQRVCLPRTGVRDALGRPVVEDGLARFARCPHKRLRSVVSRPQRAVEGVTSLGPHANSMYFAVAAVSQCGLIRAWVRLSLAAMEMGELEMRIFQNVLHVERGERASMLCGRSDHQKLYLWYSKHLIHAALVNEDHQPTSAISLLVHSQKNPQKRKLLATGQFICSIMPRFSGTRLTYV